MTVKTSIDVRPARVDDIRQLYDFNRWANERTLATAAELSAEQYGREVGGSFPSLKATLEHLFQAEGVWLSRWHGNPLGQAPDVSDCIDPAVLTACWESLWAEQETFLVALTEGDLGRPVEIKLRSGIETVQPLRDTLVHVVNHATYHRGQVTTVIRQLGGAPAATDFFVYCLQRDAGQLPPRLFTRAG